MGRPRKWASDKERKAAASRDVSDVKFVDTNELDASKLPRTARGSATLEQALADGARLGAQEHDRRARDAERRGGSLGEQQRNDRIKRAETYADWYWRETGRSPL
jgi:hypothetical protein